MGAKQSRNCCPCDSFNSSYYTTVSWNDVDNLRIHANSTSIVPIAYVKVLDLQGNMVDDDMNGALGGMLYGGMYAIKQLHPGVTTYNVPLKAMFTQYLVDRGELSAAGVKNAIAATQLAIRVYNGALA